jgi:hypothetical protein
VGKEAVRWRVLLKVEGRRCGAGSPGGSGILDVSREEKEGRARCGNAETDDSNTQMMWTLFMGRE